MTILIIAISSIVFYTHVLPILDRLTEYIQTIILTKKMETTVVYAQYEKMISAIGDESNPKTAIGFQIDSEEYTEDGEG